MKLKFRKIVIIFILIFSGFNAHGQDCSCSESLEELKKALEENYSLFKFKVNEKNRPVYDAFSEVHKELAHESTDFEDCKIILGNWLKFFRDGHVWINYKPSENLNTETIELGEEKFKSFYLSSDKPQEDLIGIWESGGYKVAIMPEENPENAKRDYVGVVLSSQNEDWNRNEIKFELKKVYGNDFNATFFMGNHSPRRVSSKLQNEGLLTFEGLNDWVKVWPGERTINIKPSQSMAYQGFHFEMLDGKIPYFRFPNFDLSFIESLNNVLEEYHTQIMEAEFMVVDVRNNSGGYDSAYYPLMPYILSGPIEIPTVYHYLSAYFKSQQEVGVEEEDIDELENEEDKAMLRLFYDNQDTLVSFSNEEYYTYSPDTFYTQPKKVAILIGEKTVSSGETFVLNTKQSDKVILYGQNTAGIIDGFNGLELELSCFSLRFPSSVRSIDVSENPIDPYGIAPDVYLDESVDVLDFALKHLRLLKD